MKQKIWILLLVLIALDLSGCKFNRGIAGSGNRKTEKREVTSFNAIDSGGAYNINVTCQKAATFEIEADDNILPLIKTEVRGGTLFIESDQEYHSSKLPTLRITLPDLAAIKNRGAGQIQIADVKNDQIGLQSDGAATIDASGTTKFVEIGATGAGKIDTGSLHAEKVKVSVSGAANIDVYATEQLDVDISGVGKVSYAGNPKTVMKSISGVGTVSPKE